MLSALNMMDWPKIETPKLNLSAKFAGPLIVLAGFIMSLWSNIIFLTAIFGSHTSCVLIINVSFITHVIISFVVSIWLKKGFNETDPDLLKPWMIVKVIEMKFLVVGIILECFFVNYYNRLLGLVPVAVIFLVIGGYIFVCIYTAYKKMRDNPQPPTLSTIDPNNVVLHNMDKPPSYDSFENQAEVI